MHNQEFPELDDAEQVAVRMAAEWMAAETAKIGVDDVESECGLDHVPDEKWNVVVDNEGVAAEKTDGDDFASEARALSASCKAFKRTRTDTKGDVFRQIDQLARYLRRRIA